MIKIVVVDMRKSSIIIIVIGRERKSEGNRK